ncbi:uncharacterized protein LOC105737101, partial [Apis florea]|uniref:uncharacterized protein LOC105737101 n=1 Tax=Apis florea TaxID=7463 RepID=UPI0006295A9E
MTKAILAKSASTIDWMRENGLETELKVVDNFIKAGGTLLTETTGNKIIQENGEVVGIEVTIKGEKKVLATKAIILADGGFVGNQAELAKSCSINPADLYSMGERKATGDGLKMLKEAGGVNNYKRIFENHAATVFAKHNPKWHNQTIFTLTCLPFLWLDREGKRFTNEDLVYDFALWGDTVYANGGYYYFLLDQQLVQFLKTKSLNWTSSFERTFRLLDGKPMTHQVGPFATIEADLQEAISENAAFKGNTLTELAEKMNVNAANLTQAPEFMSIGVKQVPFYAVRANSTTLGTVGGGLVNENFEALTEAHAVIPGIYAV